MDRAEQSGPTSSERAGLRHRVADLLRREPTPSRPESALPEPNDRSLPERVERLEALVESLQDALYRHAQLQDERNSDLHRRTQPEEIARALSADQRRRGL